MVSTMGLLEEAIREHLDLKRRAGADPGEVARQEQDAFSAAYEEGGVYAAAPSAFYDAESEPVAAPAAEVPFEAAAPEADYTGAPYAQDSYIEPEHRAAPRGPIAADRISLASQETAEIDMSALLSEDYPEFAAAARRPGRPAPAADEIGWQEPVPAAGAVRAERAEEQIPGQESLTFE